MGKCKMFTPPKMRYCWRYNREGKDYELMEFKAEKGGVQAYFVCEVYKSKDGWRLSGMRLSKLTRTKQEAMELGEKYYRRKLKQEKNNGD